MKKYVSRSAMALATAALMITPIAQSKGGKKPTDYKNSPKPFSATESIDSIVEQAFTLRKDSAGIAAIKKYNETAKEGEKLEVFQGLYDFDAPERPGDAEMPWTKADLGDITEPQNAERFAKMMQKYVYEGWFTKENKDKPDSHFRKNDYRSWCSTPWMVDGPKGREAVHGLTKEFPMHPNRVYPAAENVFVETGDKNQQPSSWGTAYFNKPVCNIYNQMFGSRNNPTVPPVDVHKKGVDNPDGFVSFKLLFNTNKKWKQYEPWQGAYTWNAFVSNFHKDNERSLQEVPHVQMDISIKDSRIKGTKTEVDHWMMVAFVYDKNYKSDLDVAHLPEPLRHMRPVGIQWGFEPGESIVFKGAKTNYKRGDKYIPDGPEALLNGPADNPSSSCLGCHAAAGVLNYKSEKLLDASQFLDRNGVWRFTFFKNKDFLMVKREIGHAGYQFNHQTKIAFDRYRKYLRELDRGSVPRTQSTKIDDTKTKDTVTKETTDNKPKKEIPRTTKDD